MRYHNPIARYLALLNRRLFAVSAVGMMATVWLMGAIDAGNHVAAFTTLPLGARLLSGMAMGPFGTFWRLLKVQGLLADTAQAPSTAWLFVFVWPAVIMQLAILYYAILARTLMTYQNNYNQRSRPSPKKGGWRRRTLRRNKR